MQKRATTSPRAAISGPEKSSKLTENVGTTTYTKKNTIELRRVTESAMVEMDMRTTSTV